jgi:hypothetical protein
VKLSLFLGEGDAGVRKSEFQINKRLGVGRECLINDEDSDKYRQGF